MRHYWIDTVQVDDGTCSLPWESHTKIANATSLRLLIGQAGGINNYHCVSTG